ncbi:MAG TPA: Uma2 family endonuclease, partial [Kofleriaceae bacterium]|nr:Uma2 family endonuclease [Kofleriaceae bacterium]
LQKPTTRWGKARLYQWQAPGGSGPRTGTSGVRHVWLIDAAQRTVEVLRLVRGSWTTVAVHRGDERVRAEPFEAVELPLGRLWAHVAPPPPRGSRASEPTAGYGAQGT